MTKSQICTQLSAFLVVIPYYLSPRYNIIMCFPRRSPVVIPYYLSLRYNQTLIEAIEATVVIPYYLSLRYNFRVWKRKE